MLEAQHALENPSPKRPLYHEKRRVPRARIFQRGQHVHATRQTARQRRVIGSDATRLKLWQRCRHGQRHATRGHYRGRQRQGRAGRGQRGGLGVKRRNSGRRRKGHGDGHVGSGAARRQRVPGLGRRGSKPAPHGRWEFSQLGLARPLC